MKNIGEPGEQKTVVTEHIDYRPAEFGACTLYADDETGEEWALRFNLCTPLDCLLADCQDAEGFVEAENRFMFEAMRTDLQLMLARIDRVRYR